MFDILVDTPKKRSCIVSICLLFVLSLVLLADLFFGFDVLKASSFNHLLNLTGQNTQSFFSYFFFSVLKSQAVFLQFSFSTILSFFMIIISSFSIWDWLLAVGLCGLIMSHHSQVSKITLCILAFYFIFRLILLGGISIYLLQVLASNNAALILNRIQLSAIMMVISHVLALVGDLWFLVSIIRNEYLKLF